LIQLFTQEENQTCLKLIVFGLQKACLKLVKTISKLVPNHIQTEYAKKPVSKEMV